MQYHAIIAKDLTGDIKTLYLRLIQPQDVSRGEKICDSLKKEILITIEFFKINKRLSGSQNNNK